MKHILILFAYSILETWLGKTKKVVANSSWELVFNLLQRGLQWVFKKKLN